MDVGATNGWRMDDVVSAAEIVATIDAEFPIEPADANYRGEVAKRWRYKDGKGEIGDHRLGHAAVLRRLHALADLRRGQALHLPLRGARPRPARARSARGASDEELAARLADIWRVSYVKTVRHRYGLDAIVRGDAPWPARPDGPRPAVLLRRGVPGPAGQGPAGQPRARARPSVRRFAVRAKGLLVELAEISLECAQLVIATDEDGMPALPAWFLVEVTRDLPRLVAAR